MANRVSKDVRLEVGESFPWKFGRVTRMCKLIKVWDWNGELHKCLPVLVFEISDSQDKRGAPATCPWNEPRDSTLSSTILLHRITVKSRSIRRDKCGSLE